MIHESNKECSVKVTETGLTFEEVYAKPYITAQIKPEIMSANALLLPSENFREGHELLFPEYTAEFFSYIKENQAGKLHIDIGVSDEDFKPIEMHSELLLLPMILVEWVAFPLLINVISSYLYNFIAQRHNAKNEHKAKIRITVQETKTKTVKTIEYEGDADKFAGAMKDITDKLF